jgi:hypothetical protein
MERYHHHVGDPRGIGEPYGHRRIAWISQREANRNLQAQRDGSEGHCIAKTHQKTVEPKISPNRCTPRTEGRTNPQRCENCESKAGDWATGSKGRGSQRPRPGDDARKHVGPSTPSMGLRIFLAESRGKLRRTEQKGYGSDQHVR